MNKPTLQDAISEFKEKEIPRDKFFALTNVIHFIIEESDIEFESVDLNVGDLTLKIGGTDITTLNLLIGKINDLNLDIALHKSAYKDSNNYTVKFQLR